MLLQSYTLPSWEFVAGEDKEQQITLRHMDGSLYDLGAASVQLTISDFVNKGSTPIHTSEQEIVDDASGNSCILQLSLSSTETKSLHGKYLYVVTITDTEGNVAKLRGPMIVYDDAKYVKG